VRILTWNLFHGRSVPGAGRDLFEQFAALLAGSSWDVALLQEVPPWWPEPLAAAAGAESRRALTSRNLGLPVRRLLARRRPDAIKSNGGGSNALLARVPIAEHRPVMLRRRPERRVAQLARLADGTVVANFHASTRVPLAEDELRRLAALSLASAGEGPLVLGGDLNLRGPEQLLSGFTHVAARDVDHLFARRLAPRGEAERLSRAVELDGRRVELSDHPPLTVELG
jgi:endonuclease/exonuclease/phosphatase family metal-dependent hydrolase